MGPRLNNKRRGVPRPLDLEGSHAVPIKIESVTAKLRFDATSERVPVVARMKFRALGDGFPMFDLVPDPSSMAFDGQGLPSYHLPTVAVYLLAKEVTRVRVLKKRVRRGELHEVFFSYDLRHSGESGLIDFAFFMSDAHSSRGRWFLERYLPANFEFDQFPVCVDVEVSNCRSPHELFTNGLVRKVKCARSGGLWSCEWSIGFPRHYTSSCHYLHLIATDRDLGYYAHQEVVRGVRRPIRITVYSREPYSILAKDWARDELARMERLYGPSPRDSVILYVVVGGPHVPSELMGMEYAGAAMVDLDKETVLHELAHFWFGRGILPAGGGAAWLDEAMVQWHRRPLHRFLDVNREPPQQLSCPSPYHRSTPVAAYLGGSQVMEHLEAMLDRIHFKGGLTKVFRTFFGEFKSRVATTEDFHSVFQRVTGVDAGDTFERLVYGGRNGLPSPSPVGVEIHRLVKDHAADAKGPDAVRGRAQGAEPPRRAQAPPHGTG